MPNIPPRLHPVNVEHSQRCYLAQHFGRWDVSQAAPSIFLGGAQTAVKQRECVWLSAWGQRVDWRVKSEGGGSCLFRTTLTDLRPRASHKIQRLPHPASLKNTILFKVYRRRRLRHLPPDPFPASPLLRLLFFLVAKTQWCAKSLENSPQLYGIWGLLWRSGTSEALPFAFKPPARIFPVKAKPPARLDRFFSLKTPCVAAEAGFKTAVVIL